MPENYFPAEASQLTAAFLEQAQRDRAADAPVATFPDQALESMLDNTWGDTAKAVVANWLGLVYQLTNLDRTKLFMEGVDPDDPLGMMQ